MNSSAIRDRISIAQQKSVDLSVLHRFSFSPKAGRVTRSALLLLLAVALTGAASAALLPVTKSAEQLLQASGNAYQEGRYLQSAELAKRLLATDHSLMGNWL